MTTEEKARAYDEALEKAREIKGKIMSSHLSTEGRKAVSEYIDTIIPELAESEDERIIKTLQEYVKNRNWALNGPTQDEVLAWLEKQKDASKAIEAVDRIDKYIDENVANAHDMKNSNPDKKYYRGWDDALGAMAGILNDVYSEEKQKESLRDFIDNFPYSVEKEQKHALKFKVGDKVHWYDDYTNVITITGFRDDAYLTDSAYGPILFSDEDNWERIEQKPADYKAFEEWIDNWWKHNKVNNPDSYDKGDEIQFDEQGFKNFCRGIRNMYQQKPVEWSEEDKGVLEDAICATDILAKDFKKDNPHLAKTLRVAKEWLESLPERFNLQPKQEWDEFDEDCLKRVIWYVENPAPSAVKDTNLVLWLKSLPERKNLPSKQEWNKKDKRMMDSIINAFRNGTVSTIGQEQWLKSLPERFSLQPKQEWSKEDERLLDFWLDVIDRNDWRMDENFCKASREFINRIKSLKPSWKPSEEQECIAERFARIIRGNLTGIDEKAQHEFEQLYFEITGNKMYGGYND